MFIGRKEERKQLLDALAKPNSFSVIYGNRRVGKTALANKACRDTGIPFVSFECMKTPMDNNIDALVGELVDQGILPSRLRFESIMDLFKYVDSLGRRAIFVLDEYPYLYVQNDADNVDSMFQVIVDKHLNNLNLILLGSHIGMMKALVKHGNPLYGRARLILGLKELNYFEASEFCPELSSYDKASFYGVFGGSPFVLSQLDYSLSLEENIKKTILNPTSSIYAYLQDGYTSDISARTYGNSIFAVLSNGNKRYNRLEEELSYCHNGLLSKKLGELIVMEFIAKNYPINKSGDDKKATYYILNNALRFFYAYVYGKTNTLSLLGADAFYKQYIQKSITTFLAYRFEYLVRQFFSLQVKAGLRDGVSDIGTYYYDDPEHKTNGEFDVALKLDDGGYAVYEAKFWKEPVDPSTITKELAQVRHITGIAVSKVGFVSIKGFASNDASFEMIDGDALYSITE